MNEGRSSVEEVHELPRLCFPRCQTELRILVEEVKKESFAVVVHGFVKENDRVRKTGSISNSGWKNFEIQVQGGQDKRRRMHLEKDQNYGRSGHLE